MHTPLAAAAAPCHTGSWLQQFRCGWNHAGHAHSVAGGLLGWLIVTVLVLAVITAVKKIRARKASRVGSAAPAGARGRGGAGRW